MKTQPQQSWPEFVSLKQGVTYGRRDIIPITESRARRDRAEGRLPAPDAAVGNVHVWRREKFIEYLRGLLRKPAPAKAPTRSASSNDNPKPQPPAAA